MHSRTLDFLSLDACLRICCSIECNMWDTPLIPRGELGPFGVLLRCRRTDIQRSTPVRPSTCRSTSAMGPFKPSCLEIIAQLEKGIYRIIPH